MKKFSSLLALLMLPQFAVAVSADDAPFEDFSVPSESGGDSGMTDVEKEIEAELAKDQKAPAPAPKTATTKKAPEDEKKPTFDQDSVPGDEAGAEDSAAAENLELDKSLESELSNDSKDSESAASSDETGADESGLLSEGLDAPVAEPKSPEGNLSAVDVLEAQLDNKNIFGSDGGDMQRQLQKLTPSEIFARIPLRNPMSNVNWVKWAGPMVEKNYVVRRNDNLWSISTRLFGTPYLWPKIWHLNARVSNPNIIEPKTVLSFFPTNPNSAPELAYTPNKEDPLSNLLPALSTENDKPTTLMEVVDQKLRSALQTGQASFKDFLLERKPRIYGKLPKVDAEGKQLYSKGDKFMLDVDDGNYNIVSIGEYKEDLFFAFQLRWRGSLRVTHKLAEITSAYYELSEGNELVKREFAVSPLAIHEATLGPVVAKKTKLVPVMEMAQLMASPNQVLGVRFPYSDSGPRPGAILTLDLGMQRTGKAVLVDRDQRVGTLWLLSADREVLFDDKIL